MLTGEIRNQIDRVWDSFWAGGIANPLEVIEQITYLLFIKRLGELHTAEELKANRTKKPMDSPSITTIFPIASAWSSVSKTSFPIALRNG
jgi:type I restriction enzyme M protein